MHPSNRNPTPPFIFFIHSPPKRGETRHSTTSSFDPHASFETDEETETNGGLLLAPCRGGQKHKHMRARPTKGGGVSNPSARRAQCDITSFALTRMGAVIPHDLGLSLDRTIRWYDNSPHGVSRHLESLQDIPFCPPFPKQPPQRAHIGRYSIPPWL